MTPTAWMIAGSIGTGVAATFAFGPEYAPDLAGGIGGPLLASVANWGLVQRTFRANPSRVTHVMQLAFLAKMVFFAAYVVVMLRVIALRPAPFALGFTAAFLALYAAQAVLLHRLFAGDTRAAA